MPRNADREVDAYLARVDYSASPRDPRGIRTRNPGNIRAGIGFKGEVSADKDGYAIFDSYHNGIRAIAVDLLTKYRRGLVTVRSIITVYAPKSENDTEAYIRAVCKGMGVTDYAWLHLTEVGVLESFVTEIIQHECGMQPFGEEQIAAACADALKGK
jgi:hypothetical protein